MTNDLKPIRTTADYEKALSEVEGLWGAKSGTARGMIWRLHKHLGISADVLIRSSQKSSAA